MDLQLIHGDALQEMQGLVDRGIKVDAIITDPPYGTTACAWDTVIPLEPMWDLIRQLRKSQTPVVLFGTEPFSSSLRLSNMTEFKYDWHWDKKISGNPLNANRMPLKTMELIHVFYKHHYFPQMRPGKMRSKGGWRNQNAHTGKTIPGHFTESDSYYPVQLLSQFSNAGSRGNTNHPTAKPIPLLEYLIRTYTRECETVLDFTMGSGSTGIACKNLNRNFIGIELDANYFAIATERIQTGQYSSVPQNRAPLHSDNIHEPTLWDQFV
jgi:DNA modification methylase